MNSRLPGVPGLSLAAFRRAVALTPLLDAEAEQALGRRVRAGDQEARQRLVQANLRLVMALARRYEGRGVSTADLIQEGALGLMRAVDRYDPDHEARFAAYAVWWIREALAAAVRRHASVAHLPTRDARRAIRLRAADTGSLHGAATASDAQAEDASRLRAALAPPAPVDDRDPRLAADADPARTVFDGATAELVRAGVDALPPRERAVVNRRFGLCGEPQSFDAIGALLGVTPHRARDLEQRALARLRRHPALVDARVA